MTLIRQDECTAFPTATTFTPIGAGWGFSLSKTPSSSLTRCTMRNRLVSRGNSFTSTSTHWSTATKTTLSVLTWISLSHGHESSRARKTSLKRLICFTHTASHNWASNYIKKSIGCEHKEDKISVCNNCMGKCMASWKSAWDLRELSPPWVDLHQWHINVTFLFDKRLCVAAVRFL